MNICVVDTTVASLMLQNRPELSLYAPHLLNVPLLTHDKDFAVDACPSIIVHRYAAP